MHTPINHPVQQLASSGTLPSKRPRSTSIPSSPTGSASSKRAISEDDFSDRTGMRAEVEGVSGSSPPVEQDAGVSADAAMAIEQSEVEERTNSLNLEEEGVEQKKYKELYSELLSAKPPPYDDYRRYALIPTSLTKQLQSAAFQPADAAVELDMSSLVEDVQGEMVYVISTEKDPDGPGHFLHHSARKERMWKLKAGLMEDEDYTYIIEEGWDKIATGLNATDKPSLLRFCVSDRIQLVPPVYTLYIASADAEQEKTTPIRFTCPPETKLFTFIRLLQSLAVKVVGAEAKSANKSIRAWTFDPSLPRVNNDAPSLAALQNIYLNPAVMPAVDSKLVIQSKAFTGEDTCDSKGFQDGDAFVLELGNKYQDSVDWVLDVTDAGHAVAKPTINMPPVPMAPAPLFSKPAAYPGTGNAAASSSNSLGPEGFGMATRSHRKERTRGLVGLQNLGNTCFMNSAVQCLSNTPELNKYFLSSVYKEEINRENPLGMRGLIADAFGLVVESLWSENPQSSFSPRMLKQYTGKFAPQFQGYGQHDTQEFIAFLLDGLHEDLNRIYKKPYIEKPDWKAGGGDLELAELGKECWEGYKKRNDSVIVDLFQGQLMSTLICPECHKESITLDPFMYLTVPLPIAQTRQFRCRFVPSDPLKGEIEVSLLIPANASFMQIKERLGALVDANPAHMVGGDLFRASFYRWWFDGDHNGECKQNDLAVFYDLGVPTTSTRKAVGTVPTEGTITVPVYTCKTTEPSKYSRSNDMTPTENCLTPFFITLTRSEAGDALAVRAAVAKGYSRFLKEEQDLWVSSLSTEAVVPMTPAGEQSLDLSTGEEERVAEIHLDGAEPRVVEVPLARSGANSPVHSLKSAHGNLSSTSLATLASARSAKLVPRADVYKIHVADASSSEDVSGSSFTFFKKDKKEEQAGVHNLWRGDAKHASSSWSSLESRRKAKKEKGNVFGRITGSLFGGSDKGDDDEREGRSKANREGSSSRAESPVAGASTSTSQAPQLVVRPGEAIFVEWSPKMYYEFIDESALRATSSVVDPLIEKEKQRKAAGKAISLEECLDEFSKEETLGQDDLWYCPICKKHQAATKKLDIYKAPDILVICIKRFGSSRRLSDKLDNLVNFPLEGLDLGERVGERKVAKNLGFSKQKGQEYGMDLDWDEVPTEITPEGEGNMVYDLYAVDNHFGGLGGGHYTAFCKNREDGQWWNYDDSRVSKANPEAVQSRAAYLLFYRRRTARPIGGISRVKAEEAESRAASRAASRAPSPAPSAGGMTGSRTLPPSGLQHASSPMRIDDDGDQLPSDDSEESEAEMTDDEDDKLPSYSRSASLSASLNSDSPDVVSDAASDADKSDDDVYRQARLSAAGLSSGGMGFGNGDRWNLTASAGASPVNFGFGSSGVSSTGTTLVDAPSQAPSPAPTSSAPEAESVTSTLVADSAEHTNQPTEMNERSEPSEASTVRHSMADGSNVSIKPASEGIDVDIE